MLKKILYTLFNLLTLSIVIYVGVDTLYRFVRIELTQIRSTAPVTVQANNNKKNQALPLSEYQIIRARNLFGSAEKPAGQAPPKAPDINALQPTTLKIALLGTVAGAEANSAAIIEETDKKSQGLYRVGDSIQNAIVRMILRGKVVLKVGEKDEILTMEDAGAPKTAAAQPAAGAASSDAEGPESLILSRSELQGNLQNVNTFLSQVRVRPFLKDGKTEGLSVSNIRAGSIFERLGLRDGDVVQSIDGTPIKNPNDIISFYRKLESGSQISLQLARQGQQKTFNYRFQ